MTDFHIVTQTELQPILDVLTNLPEHVLLTSLKGATPASMAD